MANARLGWFSPLGVAASIQASARWLALPPSASELPLGGFVLPPSASEIALGGLAFGFTASELPSVGWPSGSPFRRLPLGGLAFGLTTSAFRHAPLRGCPRWAGSSAFRFGVAAGRVGLRVHCFRFSACAASEWPLGEFVLQPSASEIALSELAFGLTASAFRHALLRSCSSAGCFFRLPFRRLPLGELAFGFTASVFRHAPLRSGCWASSFFRLPLRKLPSTGWPSG